MKSSYRWAAFGMILVCGTLFAGGQRIQTTCSNGPACPPVATACEPTANESLDAVLWVQMAGEYRANAIQSYGIAKRQFAAGMADKNWNALSEIASGPFPDEAAVILDLDETVLDNSAHQAYLTRNQLSYSPSIWAQWVKSRAAAAIPGALDFLTTVAATRHAHVFYVTNRSKNDEPDTVENLKKLGFPVSGDGSNVLSSGESNPETGEVWTSDKTARRKYIGRKYRVILLLGDQLGDFVADRNDLNLRIDDVNKYSAYWGEKWLIVPNPMYGNWEQLLSGNSGCRSLALTRKNQALRVWLPPQ
jgi:5'-nucleotidase (lipoprotein e(P4) family)